MNARDAFTKAAETIKKLVLERHTPEDERDIDDKLFFEFCDAGEKAILALLDALPQEGQNDVQRGWRNDHEWPKLTADVTDMQAVRVKRDDGKGYIWKWLDELPPSEAIEALHDLAVCCYQYDSAKPASVSNYRDALQKAYNLAVPDLAKCPHGYRRKNCGLCATADNKE